MLKLNDVTWLYQHLPMRFTLDVARGERIAVLGPSGAGKSTLLNLIAGITTPTEGGLLCDNREIAGPGPERAVVFQNHSLLPWLSCFDNVALAVDQVFRRTMSKSERREWIEHNLARVQMGHALHKRPGEISGGMKQRVGIARALAMKPPVMLFDEPTSALDPEMVGEVLSVMRGLAQEGMTMMCVTHEMNFARDVADTIWFMDQGQILEKADPDKFFTAPQHPRARRFLNDLLLH